jgi:hypothetical protein
MRTRKEAFMWRFFFGSEKAVPIDSLIDDVLDEMRKAGVNSEEYSELMTHLERLYKMKREDRTNPISRDTIALIAGNLLGILIIVAYEQKHVMTSKGFSQIIHPKSL